MKPTIQLFALLPALAGCHMPFGSSSIKVDGVLLEERRLETLEVGALPEGFEVSSATGDVTLLPADGSPSLVVQLYEKTPGDARAVFEGGRLTSRTQSGKPSAIGDVTLRTDAELSRLVVDSGMGDLEVRGVALTGDVSLETGMGDCLLEGVGRPGRVILSTGMGDVDLVALECDSLDAGSGMGDITVERVTATTCVLDTGMGDIEVAHSTFESLTGDTGMGDIDCTETTYQTGNLDTGMGRTRVR